MKLEKVRALREMVKCFVKGEQDKWIEVMCWNNEQTTYVAKYAALYFPAIVCVVKEGGALVTLRKLNAKES